jgi:hypothetical protein
MIAICSIVPAANSLYWAQTSPVPQCIAFDNGIYYGAGMGAMTFYTGNADNSIYRYDWTPTGQAPTILIANGTSMGIINPKGMVTDTRGRLYVSSQITAGVIVMVNITNTGLVSASTFYSGSLLNLPGPLAIDNLGNLYVANRVRCSDGLYKAPVISLVVVVPVHTLSHPRNSSFRLSVSVHRV